MRARTAPLLLLVAGLAVVCRAQLIGDHIAYRPGQCLLGDKHKDQATPEPEGPDYQACHQWRSEACCTADFTKQLAAANVTNIDGFHWNNCGDLSQSCQQFFVQVECFYRCSPNVAHWQHPDFSSALLNLPVCREFCDSWYSACAEDMTCAVNWITDWLFIGDRNQCKNTTCGSYRDVYGSGKGICETLWGKSFLYSEFSESDPDRKCLSLWWPENSTSPNTVAIDNLFSGAPAATLSPVTVIGLAVAMAAVLSIAS